MQRISLEAGSSQGRFQTAPLCKGVYLVRVSGGFSATITRVVLTD